MDNKYLKWEDILKPGTKVFVIDFYSERVSTICHICKGESEVSLEGEIFNCPNPHCIDGVVYEDRPFRWHILESKAITSVHIEKTSKENQFKVIYWLGCSGYPPEKVFTSKSSASKAIDKLNKEIENEVIT